MSRKRDPAGASGQLVWSPSRPQPPVLLKPGSVRSQHRPPGLPTAAVQIQHPPAHGGARDSNGNRCLREEGEEGSLHSPRPTGSLQGDRTPLVSPWPTRRLLSVAPGYGARSCRDGPADRHPHESLLLHLLRGERQNQPWTCSKGSASRSPDRQQRGIPGRTADAVRQHSHQPREACPAWC